MFLKLTVIGAVLFIISFLFNLATGIIRNRITVKFKLKLADRFISKLYSLEIMFFQAHSVGENISRLGDMEKISNFVLGQVPALLINLVRLPLILGICLWLNFKFTVFLLLVSPLYILHSLYMSRKLKPIYEAMWQYGIRLNKKIQEAFSRLLIIKAFGWERHERRAYMRLLIEGMRLGIKSFRWSIVGSISSAFLSKAIFGSMSLYGGLLIIRGKLSLGSYTAVMIYIGQLAGLLQYFSSGFERFIQDAVIIKRFFEVIETEPEVKDAPEAVELKRLQGELQFKGVSFGYQSRSPVFRNIHLSIPAGVSVGIVGPSGVGKTTLVSLMLRLYDPQEGSIILDGIDLKKISLRSLRGKILISTQEPFLFDLTIKDNISYGVKAMPLEVVEEAIKTVGMQEFVKDLPNGLNTFIGENAFRLSQGYKQRLALARAIARNPDILILDEATASIDSFTEEKIFKAMREKRQGLSTVVISHRLFSVRDADRIYFLRSDGAIEDGTHEELLGKSSLYAEFFHNQLLKSEQDKKTYVSAR